MILSKQNQYVKRLALLKDKKGRKDLGEYLAEGEKAVSEAVRLGLDIGVILAVPELYPLYKDSGYTVFETDKNVLSACSDEVTPQGVVASVKIPPSPDIKDALKGVSILLDGVKDPGNVGSIIRTCAALNVKNVILRDCADVYSPKCVRSSMCGIYHVCPVKVDCDPKDVFDGVNVIVCDMGGENVFDFVPPEKFCLVMGSESHGVSDFFKKRADHTLKLLMSEKAESLNVAVAGSLILYQLLKKPL